MLCRPAHASIACPPFLSVSLFTPNLPASRSTTHPSPSPQAYLAYHPDLAELGVTTPAAAARHYLERGRAEGRPAKRLRVLLRYTACAGLINQQYSHIAAFALAAALGAELVLPPAVCRDSFAHYFRCCWLAVWLGRGRWWGRRSGIWGPSPVVLMNSRSCCFGG